MKAICVYCGSSPGRLEAYADGARALARALLKRFDAYQPPAIQKWLASDES